MAWGMSRWPAHVAQSWLRPQEPSTQSGGLGANWSWLIRFVLVEGCGCFFGPAGLTRWMRQLVLCCVDGFSQFLQCCLSVPLGVLVAPCRVPCACHPLNLHTRPTLRNRWSSSALEEWNLHTYTTHGVGRWGHIYIRWVCTQMDFSGFRNTGGRG